MGGDIQKIEDNHGQIAQIIEGDQIYKQMNNYFSFINTSNIITITADGAHLKAIPNELCRCVCLTFGLWE